MSAPDALARLLPTDRFARWAAAAVESDRDGSYPEREVAELAASGVLAATFDPADGGRGATLRQVLEAVRVVAHHNASLARVVVDANLGPAAMVAVHGSPDQRRELVAAARAGAKPAIAITEAEAGSAATEITTRVDEGPDGLRLTGEKCWITGAPISTHYVTFARFGGRPGAGGIGVVLARSGRPGIEFGPVPRMMGMRGLPEGSVRFDGYRLDPSDVLIPPGDGFKLGMRLYNGQRLGAAMVAAAIAEAALREAVAYTAGRRQFGRPVADNQGVRWMLADMAIDVEHTLTFLRAVADCAGTSLEPEPVRVAMAKVRAAEMAVAVTTRAVQLFGARGYDTASPVERLYRDARMFTIAGGTTEMLRNLVGRSLVEGD